MASVKTRHIFIYLLVLTLAVSSCRTKKEVAPKPSTSHTTTGDNKSKDSLNEQWKRLDIPLTRHDNKRLYAELKQWLGTPYKYAGHSRNGTDCSGFVMEVYQAVYHLSLQRNSQKIFEKNCDEIDKDKLHEGDLVFFNTGNKNRRINHVGIYLKEGKFAHASSSRGVTVSDIREKYYVKHFVVAGRVRRD